MPVGKREAIGIRVCVFCYRRSIGSRAHGHGGDSVSAGEANLSTETKECWLLHIRGGVRAAEPLRINAAIPTSSGTVRLTGPDPLYLRV